MNYVNRNIRDDSVVLNNPGKFYNGLFSNIMKNYPKGSIKQISKWYRMIIIYKFFKIVLYILYKIILNRDECKHIIIIHIQKWIVIFVLIL